jgi:nicotinate (nicotinamide) nucleotide adenylyltransferase
MTQKRLGILGGAFDPIHHGHLAVAQYALDHYALDAIYFIPTQTPILKKACTAKPWQRAAMIALAINAYPQFYLDTRELTRKTPSYALLTLQSLQQTEAQAELMWILGQDAFNDFTQWHRWQEIAALCDLLVVPRNLSVSAMPDQSMIEACFVRAGHAVHYALMPCVDMASRLIRQGSGTVFHQLPRAVQAFIIENQLYGF